MKNNYNVVGDIAGQYKTLMALLAKMPQDAELLSLGDPNDRGPNSKQVIEFLMSNGKTVNSNHAHMFVEEWKQQTNPGAYPRYYEPGVFEGNGGDKTLNSYTLDKDGSLAGVWRDIPASHMAFLEKCPMYIETEDFVMTHAPLAINRTLKEACDIGDGFADRWSVDWKSDCSLLWNRYVPDRLHPDLKGKVNIFGHNSSNAVKVFTTKYPNGYKCELPEEFAALLNDKDKYPIIGICLDTSSVRVLTGLHLPTMTIYQQEYLDDNPPVRGPYGALY